MSTKLFPDATVEKEGGVGVFSSLCCFGEVEVEWVDALSFKSGGDSK